MNETKNSKIAVVIGDVHFSLSTLSIATEALELAIKEAKKLNIPLIINGDLTNDKALIRGEVLNRLISLFKKARADDVKIIVNVGNHDRIHEKNADHSLTFLKAYAQVIDIPDIDLGIIPYCSTNEEFLLAVNSMPKDKILFVHQGLKGAHLGDYYKDDSSVDPNLLSGRRIIASHYHRPQDIPLPEGGLWSFIGSPYTVTFGEANDGPKGFVALFDDGSIEHVPTNLRRHIIIESDIADLFTKPKEVINQDDLLWLKVTGPYTEIESLDKKAIGAHFIGHSNFKLDKIYTDSVKTEIEVKNLTSSEILDQLIDATEESKTKKLYLKALWREVMNAST